MNSIFLNQKKESIVQFLKFALVGASNTVVGYIIYIVALFFFRRTDLLKRYDIYLAQLSMFLLSVLWSFFWNQLFVFKFENRNVGIILKALLKTYVSYAFTSLILSEALLFVFCRILSVSEYIAPVLCLFVTMPLNFLLQKKWAFNS